METQSSARWLVGLVTAVLVSAGVILLSSLAMASGPAV
jgi:hypothetical protein